MKANGKTDDFILMLLPEAKQVIDALAMSKAKETMRPKQMSPRRMKKRNTNPD